MDAQNLPGIDHLNAKECAAITVGKYYPHEMVEKLIRAVFAAGFRIGHTSGSDEATAFEWGWRSREPQDHDAAWKVHVEPWLDPEKPWNFMNIFSPEVWEDVP